MLYYAFFRWFPKSAFSRLMGRLADTRWPRWLLTAVIQVYIRAFRIDMRQFQSPPDGDWGTFNAFFTRPLAPGARPLHSDPWALLSPVDGAVSQSGPIAGGELIQAKGKRYSLEELLGGDSGWRAYDGGTFLTIYLSPKDYHRIHTPCAGRVTRFAYEPGELWTVSPAGVNGVPNLFSRNERIVSWLEAGFGELALVAVGATVVGGIQVVYDPVTSNRPGAVRRSVRLEKPHALERGAELGRFLLGSTVILLTRPGEARLDSLQPGQALRLGQPIGAILRGV